MLGFIINFYKYATFPHTLKGDMADFLNTDVKAMRENEDVANPLLVYGDFDRLNIEKVTDFTRFRDVDFYARRWLGQRQSILLYQLEEKVDSDLLERIFGLGRQDGISIYRNFVVLTMITLDPKLHKCEEYSEILIECKKLISQQLNQIENLGLTEPNEVEYQIYGSFSSSELVIIWWVNQYSDALRLTDMLRNAEFTYGKENIHRLLPFISFYSIIGQMRSGEGKLDHPIVGSAELKLAFQDGIFDENERTEFLHALKKRLSDINEISENEIKTSRNAGEYDYSISLPSTCLCDPYKKIFHRNGPLHWDDPQIKKYISLTHVQLYYDRHQKEKVSIPNRALYCGLLKESDELAFERGNIIENIRLIGKMVYGLQDPKAQEIWDDEATNLENYRMYGLRNMIKHYFPETDGLCDTIDLLYSDYINNCTNLTSSAWASDLTTQFIEMVDFIADQIIRTFNFTAEGCLDSSAMFYDIKEISSVFIQMIYHIAQSRRTVFIVPSCHLRYMGQYDMILHAYYGIEKLFINLAYSLECNDLQPFLVPAFMIDVIPKISTDMYKIYHHYSKDKKTSGIFTINMPLGAMTDFLRYSMVVCHETAHFITPYNRDKRNQVMGMLIFSEFVAKCAIRKIWLNFYETDNEDEQRDFCDINVDIVKNTIPIIYNNMRSFYVQHIHNKIMRRKNNSDERYPKWLDYREAVTNEITDVLNKCEVSVISDFLYEHKRDFIQTVNDCLEELDNSRQRVGESSFHQGFRDKILSLLAAALEIEDSSIRDKGLTRDMLKLFDTMTSLYETSYLLCDAYREACQDLFMIRVFQIDLVDYLVFCDRHKNDILTLADQGRPTDCIRIAMVCDYLLVNEFNEKHKDIIPTQAVLERLGELYDAYCCLFNNVPEMRTSKAGLEDNNKLHDKIDSAFQNIYDSYRDYLEDYGLFRGLFLQQMKDSDLDFRFPSAQVSTDALHKFYASWKKAVLNENIEEMNSGIFLNNVAMIQHFLHQDTISGLANNRSQGGV